MTPSANFLTIRQQKLTLFNKNSKETGKYNRINYDIEAVFPHFIIVFLWCLMDRDFADRDSLNWKLALTLSNRESMFVDSKKGRDQPASGDIK